MPTRPETFMREVEHPLTANEAMEMYDEAEEIDERRQELEKRLKQDTLGRKTEIKQLEAEAARKREAAVRRKELRPVECREEKRGSQMFTVRVDSGAVVYQRALTEAEMQDDLFSDTASDSDLPLEPDYTPRDSAPRVPSERKPKAKGKGKKKR